MIAYAVDSYGLQPTASGIGRDSEDLSKVVIEASADFLFPSLTPSDWIEALSDISMLPSRCGEPGWDGEDADPLSESSQLAARIVLTHLVALGAPAPKVMADADGEVALEWARPGRSVIFTLQQNGSLSYTAIYDGIQEPSGTIVFNDVLPSMLLDKIRKVY